MKDILLDDLGELFKNNPQQLTIVEEQIDIGIQIEYFRCSQEVKKQKIDTSDVSFYQLLYKDETTTEVKKQLLALLASNDKIEAFRAIEQFHNTVDDDFLKVWSSLALKESKMMIESTLLEERQILISTGLGGKDSKLRYFIVVCSKTGKAFNATQKKVIKNEFDFVFQNNRSSVERITFDKRFSKIYLLIPLDVSIKDTLTQAIDECNNYGDFILDNYLVTNVKELTNSEIEDFLSKDHEEDSGEFEGTIDDIRDLLK